MRAQPAPGHRPGVVRPQYSSILANWWRKVWLFVRALGLTHKIVGSRGSALSTGALNGASAQGKIGQIDGQIEKKMS